MTPGSGVEDSRSALSRALGTAVACGLAPTLAVALGGAAAGIALWVPFGSTAAPFAAALAFAALAFAGGAAALAVWMRGNALLGARTGIPPIDLMRWDAWSWAAVAAALVAVLPSSAGNPLAAAVTAAAAYAAGKVSTFARYDEAVRDAVVAYLCSRVPVVALLFAAPNVLVPGRIERGAVHGALAGFARFDGLHYLAIARHGYVGADTAFFPAYPMLVRALGALLRDDVLAGIAISNVAFFIALVFLRRLIALEHPDPGVAQRTVFYIAIFPTALFFSAVYTESLFLCLSVVFFYALRIQRHWLAAFAGGLAATTRVEGVLLVVPYVVDAFAGGVLGFSFIMGSKPFRRRLLSGAAAICMGLLLYMLFLAALVGNPFAFEAAQAHWSRHIAPPWVGFALEFARLGSHRPDLVVQSAIELAFTVLALVLVAAAFRRVTAPQWSYAVVSLLVPLSTASLLSMPRFVAVLFPLFVVLARWGRSPVANLAVVCLSLVLLGAFSLMFAGTYWVS